MTTGIAADHLARLQGSLKASNDRIYELERRLRVKQTNLRKQEAQVPSVCVRRTSSQSIPDNAETTMTWQAKRWDTHTMWDGSTGLVCPAGLDGMWSIGGSLMWSGLDWTGQRVMHLQVNGVSIIDDHQRPTVDRDISGVFIEGFSIVSNIASRDWPLKAGDVVTMTVLQQMNPTGSLNVIVGANFSPEFWMTRRGR